MALGTGIKIPNNFDLNAPLPLDARFIAADITERNGIDPVARFDGLLVYVVADKKMYQLQGGITNTDWAEAGGGGTLPVATYYDDVFTDANGIKTAWPLTAVPTDVLQVLVIIGGVPQEPSAYTLTTASGVTTLTPSEVIPAGINIRAKYGVVSAGIPDHGVTKIKQAVIPISVTTAPAGGLAASVSSGNHIDTPVGYQDVPNLTVTITSTGRPICLELVDDGSLSNSHILTANFGSTNGGVIGLFRGGSTKVNEFVFENPGTQVRRPLSAVFHKDFVAAGTYTYKVAVNRWNVNDQVGIKFAKLIAYEM